jgi:hypothetical protein
MTKNDRNILEAKGWTVECESPLEIRHEDGSFATNKAAKYTIAGIVKDHVQENQTCDCLAFCLRRGPHHEQICRWFNDKSDSHDTRY